VRDYTRRSFSGIILLASPAVAGTESKFQVIAHRGEHRRNPENSASGIEAAAAMGVDFVEIDVRTTTDSQFVLMHDTNVERTTNGTGPVAGMTFSAIRKLRLKQDDQQGVPTFDEALEILQKSKSGLYLDAKQISAPNIAKVLRAHGMEERTVVYGSPVLLRELQQTGCRARVMPEARNAEILRSLLAELRPRVVAFDHRDWTPELIALAKASEFVRDLFVDRLGPTIPFPPGRKLFKWGQLESRPTIRRSY
jgi:glycerophosphoryl diester phosphodiesterase